MNNQEAFNGVMKWLTRPNAQRCTQERYGTGEACVYYNPVTENRCAIGGHLPLEMAIELEDAAIGIEGLLTEDIAEIIEITSEGSESTVVYEDLVKRIREYYDGVDSELLSSLQRLHDARDNWDKNGLSEGGYQQAVYIANEYALSNKFFHPNWRNNDDVAS